ncbi:hypothetical protein GCM10029992_53600 [Glycomyces albus]
MWWLAVLVAIVAVVGAYATWTVTRVERLHKRAQTAETALLSKLDERAETVLKFVGQPGFDEVVALALSVVAVPAEDKRQRELREYAENDLTRALRELTPTRPGPRTSAPPTGASPWPARSTPTSCATPWPRAPCPWRSCCVSTDACPAPSTGTSKTPYSDRAVL